MELWRCLGKDTDVPAGDVGVGAREVGYMYGMYTKLAREYNVGVFTGKGINWGGSKIRPEATGYGALYFVDHMLSKVGKDLKGKTVVCSGFGNVAWELHKSKTTRRKSYRYIGPDGVCHIPDGMTDEMNDYMLELRASNNNVVAPMATKFKGVTFTPGKKLEHKCDIALPCAFQNELDGNDAKELLQNGVKLVAEVSNMGCTPEAIHESKSKIMFAPGKAVNAGGVATSGLEMTQNAMHLSWNEKEVDDRLHEIMQSIHEACVTHGTEKTVI